ncbi:MAG: GGDEF domain-containing protein [Nanoarchaeota archaeon]
MTNRESPLESLVTHASVGAVQKPLRELAAQIFRGLHTQFPGRSVARDDIRYALVLLDHPNSTNLYVAEAAGFRDRHYDDPLNVLETLAGQAILNNTPQCLETINGQSPFHHLAGERRAKSALAIPLRNLKDKVVGAVVVEEVESETAQDERPFPFNSAAIDNIMNIIPGYASGLDYFTQATIDPVTGVLSRRRLDEVMAQTYESAKRSKRPYSIIMLDVDKFKDYNDTHGHPAGDEVLHFIGDIIKEHFRGKAAGGRYGGEEYAIPRDIPIENALMEAETLRRKIESESKREKLNGGITATFGVACDPTPSGTDYLEEAKRVLGDADKAMYAGKGKWVFTRGPNGLWGPETSGQKNRVMFKPLQGARIHHTRQRFVLDKVGEGEFKQIPSEAETYGLYKL